MPWINSLLKCVECVEETIETSKIISLTHIPLLYIWPRSKLNHMMDPYSVKHYCLIAVCFCGVLQTENEQTSHSLYFWSFSPITSLFSRSECEPFSQSVEPHGQIGVPLCQVEFRKHSSCCLVWVPCVGAGVLLSFTDPTNRQKKKTHKNALRDVCGQNYCVQLHNFKAAAQRHNK